MTRYYNMKSNRQWKYIASQKCLWQTIDFTSISIYCAYDTAYLDHCLSLGVIQNQRECVKELRLSNNTPISPQFLERVLSIGYPNLESLYIQRATLASHPQRSWGFHHLRNTKLRTVSLRYTFANTDDVNELLCHVGSTLRSLDLGYTNIGSMSLYEISELAPNLEYLNIDSAFRITERDLNLLRSNLIVLSLNNCYAVSKTFLKNYLKNGSRLQYLSVKGCDALTRKDISTLVELSPGLNVIHTAILDDDTIEGYTKFIEAICNATYVL